MGALMSDGFRDQIALKTFLEISPTYSRVFAGYADWTREAMDAFADYYDQTFRKAGTLIYAVPGRMPHITADFDAEKYAERVAENLEYLIKVRACTRIRYYCVTNELSVGNTYAYLENHLDTFRMLHECLYRAFRRHGLDVGLLASDCSGVEKFGQLEWVKENMDEITECYCAHLYCSKFAPGDPEAYDYYTSVFSPVVMLAHSVEKRFVLGEFGINKPGKFSSFPMRNDVSYAVDVPESDPLYAIAICEYAMAAINCGCFAAVFWTMFDYPDPFIRENGDTPEQRARYDAARFSGHGLDIRYNKNGLVKWCDCERDYGSRASLYTLGRMARLFKKGSRVLSCEWEDASVRASAVINDDGTISIALINWEDREKTIDLSVATPIDKPLRRYDYTAQNVVHNPFNDLSSHSATLTPEQLSSLTLAPVSFTVLTTDYTERTPTPIENVRYENGRLSWDESPDDAHRYYRVYASDESDFAPVLKWQIASTVATSLATEPRAYFKVLSVDKDGNV